MKTKMITITAILAAITLIPTAFAQENRPGRGIRQGLAGPDAAAQELLYDLSPEQHARVREYVQHRLRQQRQRQQRPDFERERGPRLDDSPQTFAERAPRRGEGFGPQERPFARGPEKMQHPQDEHGRFERRQRGPQGRMPQRQGRPGSPGQGGPMGGIDVEQHLQRLTRTLDLTPEQQEAVEIILDEHRENAVADRKAIQATAGQLREAVLAGDAAAAEAHSRTLSDLMARQAVAQAQTVQAVNEQLTDEQRKTLAETREQMRQRGRQFRQDRGGRFAPEPDDED